VRSQYRTRFSSKDGEPRPAQGPSDASTEEETGYWPGRRKIAVGGRPNFSSEGKEGEVPVTGTRQFNMHETLVKELLMGDPLRALQSQPPHVAAQKPKHPKPEGDGFEKTPHIERRTICATRISYR